VCLCVSVCVSVCVCVHVIVTGMLLGADFATSKLSGDALPKLMQLGFLLLVRSVASGCHRRLHSQRTFHALLWPRSMSSTLVYVLHKLSVPPLLCWPPSHFECPGKPNGGSGSDRGRDAAAWSRCYNRAVCAVLQ